MDDCGCEQSAATEKPTYRVGAACLGREAAPRVGRSARVRARRNRARTESEEDELYNGLEIPDLKDLRSPEVAGLREKVSSARQEAWRKVEKGWQSQYRGAFEREIRERIFLNGSGDFSRPSR